MIPTAQLQHTLVPADLPRLFALAVRLGLRESIDYAALEPGLFAQSTVPSLDGIAENWVRKCGILSGDGSACAENARSTLARQAVGGGVNG